MNVYLLVLGAVFLTAMMPALINPQHFRFHLAVMRRALRLLSVGEFLGDETGVVVVTYLYPVGTISTTIAPTQTVMAGHRLLIAQVFMDTADTIATVTHNWNYSTLGTVPGGLYSTAFNLPIVTITPNQQGTVGVVASVQPVVSSYSPNTIGITKANASFSSVTFTVYLEQPWSPTS